LTHFVSKAQDVIFACEQAVALAPHNGQIRDSRGAARVLTRDLKEAIEDFEAAYADPNLGCNFCKKWF
jgi:hypothetical protein